MKHITTTFLFVMFSIVFIGTNLMSQTRIPKSVNVHDVVKKISKTVAKSPEIRTTESAAAGIATMRSRPGSFVPLKGTPISPVPSQVTSGSILNVPSTFPTIQAAINVASNGDTINVYPGTYNQDVATGFDPSSGGAGSNNFNIFVNKSVVIRGVTALGVPITDVNSISAFVAAKLDVPDFGADAIFVQADNVTISGLDITGYLDVVNYNSKSVEVAGNNFTLKNCKVHGLDEAAAIYLSDWHYNSGTDVSYLQSYTFQGNYIDAGGVDADGIRIASGAGWSGPVSGRVISGNTFTDAIDNIAFVGPGAEAWDLYPVGAATITGNSFSNAARRHIIAWGLYNSNQGYANLDWLNILANNTFDKAVIPWSSSTTVRSWDSPSYGYYNVRGIYTSIQHYAVNYAQAGDSVQIYPGTYADNITITVPLTLNGAGQGSTTIYPAISDPGTPDGASFSNSQVIVVSANNVTISNLTIDGDNPGLTSSVVVNGADVDARNGIIESDGPWNNTTVHHTTVKNIYLRGIYARSGGSGFNFHDNTVQNVDGSPNSIAMFNFGGSGIFSNNSVSEASDAISANWSRGTQFLNNTITNSLSGIHTDNSGGSGGVADLIQGNSVSSSPVGGYGIWAFVPYNAPTIIGNTVTGVDVGFGAFGAATGTVTTPFIRNVVDGQNKANSVGMYISNTEWGYGVSNVAVSLTNNVVNNNTFGFDFESANGDTVTCSGYPNSMTGNGTAVFTDSVLVIYGGTGTAGYLATDVRGYWWGSINPPSVSGPTASEVVYSPWLGIGTDADLVTMGFQAVSPMTWYANTSNTLQNAVNIVAAGDVLKVLSGTYTEQVEIAKTLTLCNASSTHPVLQSPVTLTKYFATSANNFPILYVHDAASVVVRNFTVDGAGRGNGNYRFMGIGYFNAGGTIDSCLVKDVRETPINGDQHGNAIYAYVNNATPRTLNVTNCTVNGFQKNGITTNGTGMTGIITNNVVTGAGAINFNAQNGIQIGFGATGTVSGNNVTGVSYTPSSDVACALLVYDGTDPVITTNNTFTNSTVGIYYINNGGTISGNTITATTAACGTPTFWGIDVDPGSTPRLKPQPFTESMVSKSTKLKSVSSTLAISTIVHDNTLTSDGTGGTGLEMDALGGQTLNVHAYRNTITQWGYGVYFYSDPTSTLSAVVDTNTIAGNVYGAYNQTGQLQSAFLNWWGNASGPRDVKTLPNVPNYNNPNGTGDSVSSYINYNPWYLDAAKTLQSVFTLTVNATNGSVLKNPNQASYNAGTSVQLTATPAANYHFVSWTGDISSSVNPVTTVMYYNKTVTANFAINTFTLTYTSGANGTISGTSPQTVNFGTSGTAMTAVPNTGYRFVNWSDGSTANPRTDANVTGNISVTANFTLNKYAITMSATNHVVAGIDILALDGVDPQDTGAPPPPPSNFVQLYFLSAPGQPISNYVVDFKKDEASLVTQAKHWALRSTSDLVNSVQTITFSNSNFPSGFKPVLYDLQTGKYQNVSVNPSFTFQTPSVSGQVSSFTLLIGDSTKPAVTVIQPNGGEVATVGRPDTIRWSSTDGTGILRSYIYYSLTGSAPYTLIDSTNGNVNSYVWTPPSGYSLSARIRVVARDSVMNEQEDVSDQTFTINQSSSFLAPAGWSLVSVPLLQSDMTPAGVFGDNYGAETYFVWQYSGLYSAPSILTLGQGYWLGSNVTKTVDAVGTPLSSVNWSTISGFNIIGDPFISNEPLDSIRFTDGHVTLTLAQAAAAPYNWLSPVLYKYTGTGYAYETSALGVWKGYWIPMLTSGISIQYAATVGSPASVPKPSVPVALMTSKDWSVDLSATLKTLDGKTFTDEIASFGVRSDAKTGFDSRYDAPRPPRNPDGNYVEVSFTVKGDSYPKAFGTSYARDYQAPGIGSWDFAVNTSGEGQVILTWNKEAISSLGNNVQINLYDMTAHKLIDMKNVGTYTYQQAGTSREFMINNADQAIPSSFQLAQNYPNPFNPTTVVRFGIPQDAVVSVEIYNTLGQKVVTLLNGEKVEAGYHEVSFDGSRLASGVYLYRISATGSSGTHFTESKKMLLVK